MSKVSMFGKFTVAAGKETEIAASFADQAAAASGADGVEVYSYHRSEDGNYWYFAQFRDMESFQALGQSDAMQAAMQSFGPLLGGQPDMSMTVPISEA